MGATTTDAKRTIRRLSLTGFAIIVLLFGGIGGWAATSRLSGAVIAPGTIVVESSVKKVQHATGGIVGALLVEEGSSVDAGQVLVKLDDTIARTTLGTVQADLDAELLRGARLVAERDGADAVTLPAELASRGDDDAVTRAFSGEARLFEARHDTLVGQRAQLGDRVTQLNAQIEGLTAQLEAKKSETILVEQELVHVSALYAKNLVTVAQVIDLQRNQASLKGELGRLDASIAEARGKISETELQILQLGKDFQTSVLNDLRDSEAKISDLRQRQTAAQDQLNKADIRAPQSGVVHELTVHTIGGVIGPGETIMLIVPRADKLVIDAKIAPQDVDQVMVGADVGVHVMAGNRRTTPDLKATVIRVSPDLLLEAQTNRAYYLVRMVFTKAAMLSLADLHLLPGMPVEAYIGTQERTPLEYLLKPLREQIARTFRER